MSSDVVFLGGPKHGELLCVPTIQPVFQVPKTIPIDIWLDTPVYMPSLIGTYRLSVYTWTYGGGKLIFFYEWQGWSDEEPPSLRFSQVDTLRLISQLFDVPIDVILDLHRPSPPPTTATGRQRLQRWLDDTEWVDGPDAMRWDPECEGGT